MAGAQSRSRNLGRVAEAVRQSTVEVLTRADRSSGSGVALDGGRILTNAHVLARGPVHVRLWTGEITTAQLIRHDTRRDLALLQVAQDSGQPAAFREQAPVPGEIVIAVGNPLGFLGAMSMGVVHAVGALPGLRGREWIQTTARLAPGNSGGPLADVTGQILGVNTMIYNSLGLAVPGSAIQKFLLRDKPALRLGITVRQIAIGLLILQIEPGSPADLAALKVGDTLLACEGVTINTPDDLADALETAGAFARVKFRRGAEPAVRETVARGPLERAA